MSWTSWAAAECQTLRGQGRWRELRVLDAAGVVGTLGDGAEVVSFASNDYLGLSSHPAVVDAAVRALGRWGAGAGASRLVTGSRPVHALLEEQLAEWKHAERALVFPTGFAANLGVLGALGGPGVRVFSDEFNHASIVDGCRLSRAETVVYPHGDVGRLRELLRWPGRTIVVSDTVFSMDGDMAPVVDLVGVCAERGALLVLDDAHVVLGPEFETDGAEVLRVGTLSKALGSLGGFVAGPAALIEVLVNRARPFIFSTASAPAAMAAAVAALEVVRGPEGDMLRGRLRANVDRVRPGHPSPIVPVVLGGEAEALTASQRLLARGLLVPAIRPPTVPAGTSRLRVTLSAAHTDAQVGALVDALSELGAVGAAA